ncbi:MAG: SIMPL domain-containing protein [Ignavibacteriae bacterium]|nr:SIMPL domain-containing protein [Ignavibacteriota bacterium]
MTKSILSLCILAILHTSPSFAQWDQGNEIKQNHFTTFGNATLYFAADRAQFDFYVKGEAATIEEALRIASERVTRIGNKLKTVGLSENQLQTSYFNSAENKEGKSWWTSSKDFAAGFQITVTIDSFDLIEPALSAIASEAVEFLSKLTFSLKNDQEKQLMAYKAAAEDARKKAELVATTLGATINRVLLVDDQSAGSGYSISEVAASVAPKYVYSGKQFPVTSRLRVVFELGYKQ